MKKAKIAIIISIVISMAGFTMIGIGCFLFHSLELFLILGGFALLLIALIFKKITKGLKEEEDVGD